MKKALLYATACSVASLPMLCIGRAVETDAVEIFSINDFPLGTTHEFRITKGNGTSAFFGISESFAGFRIDNTGFNLDEASDWYLVDPGEVFSVQTIREGRHPTLLQIGFNGDLPFLSGPVDVPTEQIAFRSPIRRFYLGFATSIPFQRVPADRRDIYGWVEVHADFSSFDEPPLIFANSSAVAIDSSGIIVGTLQAIPEPTSAALLACLALAGSVQRRR